MGGVGGRIFIFVFIYYSLKRWSTGVPLWVWLCVPPSPCSWHSFLSSLPPAPTEASSLSKQPINALCDLLKPCIRTFSEGRCYTSVITATHITWF